MTRIAYLLSQYPAYNHVFMLREVRMLRQRGFEIHVASVRATDRPLEAVTQIEREEIASTYYVKQAGIAAALLAHTHLFSRPGLYFRGLRCALRVAGRSLRRLPYALAYFTEALLVGRWMKQRGLSHVHGHFISGLELIVARTFPVTMSSTYHGPEEFANPASFRLAEKVEASLFSCGASYWALSQLMYACPYEQWSKFELSPWGVPAAELPPRPEPPASPTLRLLTAGRLAPVKGQHVMIDAVARAVREGYDVRLHLAGDGAERASLEADAKARGIADRVVFEGNLNQDQLRAVYRDTDVFILASFGEGLPAVLIEAMSMEVPCIATWVAGVPELIRDGIEGLLAAPGDAASLAGAIIRLARDPALRRQMGKNGRQRVLERYDLAVIGANLCETFQRRLSGPRPGSGGTQAAAK